MMQPIGYVGNAGDRIFNGEADTNSIWNAPAQLTSAFREGATSNVYNEYDAYAQELAKKEALGQTVTQAEKDKLDKMGSKADALAFLANTGYDVSEVDAKAILNSILVSMLVNSLS